jgi:hypothetical protein
MSVTQVILFRLLKQKNAVKKLAIITRCVDTRQLSDGQEQEVVMPDHDVRR